MFINEIYKFQSAAGIAAAGHSVRAIIKGMWQELIFMFLVAIILSLFLAKFISHKLCNSINKIDLDNPELSNVYKELKPFTKRISEENFEKEERETLRQQFTANVSHELKTPLTSISGFAEILKEGLKDDCKEDKGAGKKQRSCSSAFNKIDNKTIIDFSTSIYDESQRMINLVNDIIKLSRLDEQTISQEKEEISLREISKEIWETLQSAATKKKITMNLTGDSGNITGVRPVIYEMIFNLCDNAIKYNKEGGSVFIKINTEEKRTGVQSGASQKKVSISVSDTGIGIPAQEQERVFERFYRVDKSRSKELGGTGLGLSIVKHGAIYHDAKVEVKSQEGKGTTFTIVF